MRAHLEISEAALLHSQLQTIPVSPWFARDDSNFVWRRDLAQPSQLFFEDRSLNGKLIGIRCVLIMTAAASSEYRARRGHPAGRRLQDFHRAGVDQARFFP